MAKKQLKTSLVIIKTVMKYYCIPIRMAKLTKPNTKC